MHIKLLTGKKKINKKHIAKLLSVLYCICISAFAYDPCGDVDMDARIEPFTEESMQNVLFVWSMNKTAAKCLYPELKVSPVVPVGSIGMRGFELVEKLHFQLGDIEAERTIIGRTLDAKVSIQPYGMDTPASQYVATVILP